MLQLVNLSNYQSDLDLIHSEETCLRAFLRCHHLDGVEMMFCDRWNRHLHKPEYIQGVHLKFWPCWLDFWRENHSNLLTDFGTEKNIKACFGSINQDDWLNLYRENIKTAIEGGAKYLVFHVGHVRPKELFNWEFKTTDQEVAVATVEVVNRLSDCIPEKVALLFENLWWPGLTLKDPYVADFLLSRVNHKNSGIMLDTGHLMNTNQNLQTEIDAIEYVLATLHHLGSIRQSIRGVHLHKSLSGSYVKTTWRQAENQHDLNEIMTHVLQIDQHLPFEKQEVGKIIDLVEPEYLVHEFMQVSMDDWHQKVLQQQQTLLRYFCKKKEGAYLLNKNAKLNQI